MANFPRSLIEFQRPLARQVFQPRDGRFPIISSRKRMISASPWMVCPGARGSPRQAANRAATPRQASISRSASTPASEESSPPSNRATTVLPDTGDRPGSGIIGSAVTGTASGNGRIRLQYRILIPFNGLRYTRQPTCAFRAKKFDSWRRI